MPRNSFLTIAALTVVFVGCSEEVVIKRMKPGPPAPVEAKAVEDISNELVAFEPPFKGRFELFEPEKKIAKAPGTSTAKRTARPVSDSASTEPEIELVGFGAVHAPHAILMIDGRLEALRVGEQFQNVRVLEISPPSVQLRVAGKVREAKLDVENDG
ncbi:MAG: hypothetical protein MI757_07870 [Pirellulales bacterium]|nr:hypothetical protein [Pirellulales bacterium]